VVDEKAVAAAAGAVERADALLITAGAGMGVDSGLPDFRGDEGFWRAYPPMKQLGISFVSMANPTWFTRDPELAWGFYGHRFNLYRDTEPHRGFAVLLGWAGRMKAGAFVFTSNVDGQFQKAGFAQDRLIECHGSINHLQCSRPCHQQVWEGDELQVTVDESSFRAVGELPSCPECHTLARPNVLMFNDWSWVSERTAAQEQRLERWLASVRGRRLVVIELGAGSAVPTVRLTSEHVASRLGAPLVRINPREPQAPAGQLGIAGGALEVLEAIDTQL